jgi:hypothetical protein
MLILALGHHFTPFLSTFNPSYPLSRPLIPLKMSIKKPPFQVVDRKTAVMGLLITVVAAIPSLPQG